jgi:type I restriction enzyme S subunit
MFFTRRSNLEGRLDPKYNLARVESRIKSAFPSESLGKLCRSLTGGTPSTSNFEYWGGQIPWVSPKDFKTFYLNDASDHITQAAIDESSTSIAPENSMLIVFRSGVLLHTIPVAVATRDVAINQDVKALIFDDRILPAYVAYFFIVFQDKLLPLITKHGATVQSINTEQFDKMQLPIPPYVTQARIAKIMDTAYAAKKSKEAEAQALLDSIDDYLLAELGIHLPKKSPNSLKDRMFVRPFSELSGGRFDPLYRSGNIYWFLDGSKLASLKKYARYFKSGFASGKDDQSRLESDIVQIRSTNITENSDFIFNRNVYIDREQLGKRNGDVLVKGEVLFNNTNSQDQVGKTILFDLDGTFFVSNHITRIALDEKSDARFLAALFNLYRRKQVFFKLCTNWNNQSGIGLDVLANIQIPEVPVEKQQVIADHISEIRAEAKQLREEAAAGLEKANAEVEKMILGG